VNPCTAHILTGCVEQILGQSLPPPVLDFLLGGINWSTTESSGVN